MGARVRSVTQEAANAIDLDIFNALRRAEGFRDTAPPASTEYRRWQGLASGLSNARYWVRLMMHEDDLRDTA